MIIGNDISVPDIGFGSDDNAVVILTQEGTRESLPRMSKRAIADHIFDIISERFRLMEEENGATVGRD